MKAVAGWGAAALAVATLVGLNPQLGNKSATAPQSPGTVNQTLGRQAVNVEAKSAFERGPCADLEDTIRTFLLAPTNQIAAPVSCYGNDPKEPEYLEDQKEAITFQPRANTLQFVIAILPDPAHTHFSLSFDRLAEAVQQGAQDEGYFYDSSWLPWETEEKPLVLLADQNKADDEKKAREEQPGILLFRKKQAPKSSDPPQPGTLAPYEEGLVVFIVGEEPTGGVHKRQLENALNWVAALQPWTTDGNVAPAHPLKVLGPSFSGSLPSLAQLLAEDSSTVSKLYANAPDRTLSIYSGSVTSNALVKWFIDPARGIGTVRFRSFQQDGDGLFKAYREYLKQLKFEVSHLAILSEDETAYGGYGHREADPLCKPLPDEGKIGPTCLYYPRDLSALRGAYQKEGIFSTGSKAESADAARQLATDLADPEGKEHDTIRNYSGDQTALSQEAILQQIVSMLQAHESQYIVLRSSNPLDQIFLSHYLRRAYPAGRIVIEGSDLLMRRETGATALSGIMTLTNYPLLPWEYHWTAPSGDPPYLHAHRVFAQEGSESAYLALRFLLNAQNPIRGQKLPSNARSVGDQACECEADCLFLMPNRFVLPNGSRFALPDYAAPFWNSPEGTGNDPDSYRSFEAQRPSVWLSVLGRDGFWPVAALNGLGTEENGEEAKPGLGTAKSWWHLVSTVFPRDASEADHQGRPEWPPMPISMKICLLTVFLLAAFHLHCCWRPSVTVKPVHRAHFVRIPRDSHSALVLFGSVVVALIPILLAWGYGAMSLSGEPVPHAWWYRALLPLSWLLAGSAVWLNARDSLIHSTKRQASVSKKLKNLLGYLRKPWFLFDAARKSALGLSREWKRLYETAKPRRKDDSELKNVARHLRAIVEPFIAIFGSVMRNQWGAVAVYLVATVFVFGVVDFFLDQSLNAANRIPTYWRSIHLTTGVSPLVPFLALTAGLYLWFWYSLQGLALFGRDRPMLPTQERLEIEVKRALGPPNSEKRFDAEWLPLRLRWLCMFSREKAAKPLETLCDPFAAETVAVAVGVFVLVGLIALVLAGWEAPIRNLGARTSAIFFCLGMDICISLMLANAWQFLRVWLRLRNLLLFLDRIPLRRTTKALKDISWGSVWKMSGSILDVRYKLLSRQLESLTHLANSIASSDVDETGDWMEQIKKTQHARDEFIKWYAKNWDNWKARNLSTLRAFQRSIAETAGFTMAKRLLPEWRKERKSLILDLSEKKDTDVGKAKDDHGSDTTDQLAPHIRNAEEFVCLVYLGFVQNILGRMRTLAMQMLWLFIALSASVATYPFDPRPALSGTMLVLFLILGAVVVVVYSQMHRDGTLSLVTNTTPGELGMEFWIKLISFAVGPLLALLATNFPGLPGSLFSWLQPGLQSIK